MILAYVIATLIPLLFLYLVYALDLYSSGSFRVVVTCFAWGLIAFLLAFALNSWAFAYVSASVLIVVVAPVLEEFVKSLSLIYYVRRPDFNYFVDGAIYGFAAGIAFSILENYLYLQRSPSGGTILVLTRTFSTCLMHGSASALVGVSVGRLRFGHGWTRLASLLLGWAAAIVLHASFNQVVDAWYGPTALMTAVAVGFSGLALIVLFIRWGLLEERRWIQETLGLHMGVTRGEVQVIQEMANLETLLTPIAVHFGREKARLVEQFLVKQAQLGIKRKASHLTADPRLRVGLEGQIAELRRGIEDLRKRVGIYCMAYVRTIFPPESQFLWDSLERLVAEQVEGTTQFDLWQTVGQRLLADG